MSTRHIVHIVHRFAIGGLENGIVNLINRLPSDRYRHSIICLDGHDPLFASRLQPTVQIESIEKRPGADWKYYSAMWKLLRRLRPDVVHTRNVATLEYQLPAFAARVPRRIHGEHGWDMSDLHGSNARYIRLKRALRPLIHDFIGLSGESCQYLRDSVGVAPARCHQIINGVDTVTFTPDGEPATPPRPGFIDEKTLVFGTVGRLATVKNQRMLVNAFIRLCRVHPDAPSLRLVIVGDGEHRQELAGSVAAAGLESQVWLAGSRDDIPALMRLFDVFVLPSLAEGISNTLLEALASGLPVIATHVGGNPELVQDGVTGQLIECSEDALLAAMEYWVGNRDRCAAAGQAAREDALTRFSLATMVAEYTRLYQGH